MLPGQARPNDAPEGLVPLPAGFVGDVGFEGEGGHQNPDEVSQAPVQGQRGE